MATVVNCGETLKEETASRSSIQTTRKYVGLNDKMLSLRTNLSVSQKKCPKVVTELHKLEQNTQ